MTSCFGGISYVPAVSDNNEHLVVLRTELHKKYKTNQLDGYCLYLYVDNTEVTNHIINISLSESDSIHTHRISIMSQEKYCNYICNCN